MGAIGIEKRESQGLDPLTSSRRRFGTILADPPWRFTNRTGKMAPEHKRLSRYATMTLQDIQNLPVAGLAKQQSHLYLWVPNALILDGIEVMRAWGFTYKTNMVWYKVRKDGGPDGRGVGFYFRNVTELVLFGIRGSLRTLAAGRRQTNVIVSRKREHSRKPDELYDIIERCSPGAYLELFARHPREGWCQWGDETDGAMLDARRSQARRNGTGTTNAVRMPLVLPTTASTVGKGRGRKTTGHGSVNGAGQRKLTSGSDCAGDYLFDV
ncbi:MAG: S-adenosylmethionine-binding protein [Planctomycetes bacterium]|nr:S-adenosylmethionine-binding protein [Planctomycetota bacterium]